MAGRKKIKHKERGITQLYMAYCYTWWGERGWLESRRGGGISAGARSSRAAQTPHTHTLSLPVSLTNTTPLLLDAVARVHRVLLVDQDLDVARRARAAHQRVAERAVLGLDVALHLVLDGARQDLAGARRARARLAQVGQLDVGGERGLEDGLRGAAVKGLRLTRVRLVVFWWAAAAAGE